MWSVEISGRTSRALTNSVVKSVTPMESECQSGYKCFQVRMVTRYIHFAKI